MLVLSVDSSSATATCALVKDDQILGEINLNSKREHSVIIMDLIEEILNRYKLSINDVDAFAVSEGPGSFTGLRIGMATIKGMAFSTKKPCISISTLDALAYNVVNFDGIVCPIIDALRDNVYTNLYKNVDGKLTAISEAACLSLTELIEDLNNRDEKVIFVGDGVAKHRERISEEVSKSIFAPLNCLYPKASSLGEIAIDRLNQGITSPLNEFAPVYLRKSQAETEYEQRMGI